MYEEALAEAKQYFAAAGLDEVAEALDSPAEAGYQGAMRRAAETLTARSEQPNVIATTIAELYICAGDKERALEWLETGFDARDTNISYLGVNPIWDSLRDEPRFQDLLRKMNLPQ